MKTTGMVRRIDELGRIVIPLTIRQKLNLHENDYLEICKSGKNITLNKIEKYQQKEHLNNFNITLNNEIQINIDISKLNNNIPTATKGIVRTIDQLGRIIIPMQLRKDLGIKEKDSIKICYKDNMIILIKKEYDNHNRRKQNFNQMIRYFNGHLQNRRFIERHKVCLHE